MTCSTDLIVQVLDCVERPCMSRDVGAPGSLMRRANDLGRRLSDAEAKVKRLEDEIERLMARPIEPTPTLEGEAAQRLLRDLDKGCSPPEAKRRIDSARIALATLKQPKGGAGGLRSSK